MIIIQKLLLVSLDAVGDPEFEKLLEFPHFKKLTQESTVVRNVDTIFLSNTYPIHASVATGVPPSIHGVISNTEAFPEKEKDWFTDAARIRVETLWQAAARKGYRSAAVMWPVTGGAKELTYNIPEVMAKKGESQIITSLKAGSKPLQIREFLRHRGKLNGIKQPELDDFSCSCMVDIIRKYKPELMLMHLTAYDFICHEFGKYGTITQAALQSLDENLGRLLEVIDDDTAVVTFSDHSQIQVHSNVVLNEVLVEMGLLQNERGTFHRGAHQCFFECCGGSAFFHSGKLSAKRTQEVSEKVSQSIGFGRFLTPEEMKECGRKDLAFGCAAARGYSYCAYPSKERANHGYPVDYRNYQVFYTARGKHIGAGKELSGGSILDITALAAAILGMEMQTQNPLRKEVYAYENNA